MSKKGRHFIVAIDGPAGSGKSTVSRTLANMLGWVYIDTGAMYRAVTLKALRKKINLDDENALARLAKNTDIMLKNNDDGKLVVLLDGKDVTKNIRTLNLTKNVSKVARVASLRKVMVNLQRKLGKASSSIIEGRDTTTVVFPDADVKFYLDAKFSERTNRRFKEFTQTKDSASIEEVREDLKIRDHKDRTRDVGALKIAPDAVYVDTSDLNIDEVADKLLKIITERIRAK